MDEPLVSPRAGSSGGADPLELENLDADSLFAALSAVEQSVPILLGHVKPILSHLSGKQVEGVNEAAEGYMDLLDKIQSVFRHTIYYLRETNASTTALRAPLANHIPTPFSATLPDPSLQAPDVDAGPSRAGLNGLPPYGKAEKGENGAVELGLYGLRIEERTLREMKVVLDRLKAQGDGVHPHQATSGAQNGRRETNGNGDADAHEDMEVDEPTEADTGMS